MKKVWTILGKLLGYGVLLCIGVLAVVFLMELLVRDAADALQE